MHRRMSLGVGMLLLLVLLAGSVSVSAEPLAASEASRVESFSLLSWAWEWIASLVGENPVGDSSSGGGHLNGMDGGGFMDPNGGNS